MSCNQSKHQIFKFFCFGILIFMVSMFLPSESFCSVDNNSNPDVTFETGTVTDIDGNVYQTVKIGNQWWMAENLKVTHYRNGDEIPHVTNDNDWSDLSTGAYCYLANNVNDIEIYGNLYNGYAVNDSRNIAPTGWHVPSDDEWKELEIYLGMSQTDVDALGYRGTDEGGKLKESGTIHWKSPNIGATNETGFSGLPSGYRHSSGSWHGLLRVYTGFWSTTEYSGNMPWYRSLDYNNSQVGRQYFDKRYGFSIRCVKNVEPESCIEYDMTTDPGFTCNPYDSDNYYDTTNKWYHFTYAEVPNSTAGRNIYKQIPTITDDFKLEFQIYFLNTGYDLEIGLCNQTSRDDFVGIRWYDQASEYIDTDLYHNGSRMSNCWQELRASNPNNTGYYVIIKRTNSNVSYEIWNEDKTSLYSSKTYSLDYVDTMNYFLIYCFPAQYGGEIGEARLKYVKICTEETEHTVSKPNTPSGLTNGIVGQSLSYSTGGSSCNKGHNVQYRFDWGDNNFSTWGSSTQTYIYNNPGTYTIKAQARCVDDNSIISAWSSGKSVTISQSSDSPPINPIAPDKAYPGEEFWVDIEIGSNSKQVSDLKVVSFEFQYTNTSIIDYVSYEIGPFLTGAQANVIPEDQIGKISASVYKISGGDSGYGIILRFKFKILNTASEGQIVNFSFTGVQANKSNGVELVLTPMTSKTQIKVGVSVWPGDANNDGQVSIFDINSIIAIHWNKTGPSRPNASNNWIGQICQPWTSVDATYADCNGSGKVDIFDINSVVINFGKTHSLLNRIYSVEYDNYYNFLDGPPVIIQARDFDHISNDFWLDIKVGSANQPVNDLKVVSFELTYSNTDKIDYIAYEIGEFPSDAQATVVPEDNIGRISAAVYRLSGGNSGHGIVICLKFNAEIGNTINFNFDGVMANDSNGNTIPLTPQGNTIITSIEEQLNILPTEFALYQNYPNPFNPSTTIQFDIPEASYVVLEIYNIAGQQIETLVSENKDPGSYRVQWNASRYSNGIYYYRIKAGDFVNIKKMVLMK